MSGYVFNMVVKTNRKNLLLKLLFNNLSVFGIVAKNSENRPILVVKRRKNPGFLRFFGFFV